MCIHNYSAAVQLRAHSPLANTVPHPVPPTPPSAQHRREWWSTMYATPRRMNRVGVLRRAVCVFVCACVCVYVTVYKAVYMCRGHVLRESSDAVCSCSSSICLGSTTTPPPPQSRTQKCTNAKWLCDAYVMEHGGARARTRVICVPRSHDGGANECLFLGTRDWSGFSCVIRRDDQSDNIYAYIWINMRIVKDITFLGSAHDFSSRVFGWAVISFFLLTCNILLM